MFHLSLPVEKFEECLSFYRSAFGAEVVMLAPGIADVFVFGAQVTLHDQADSSLNLAARRTMHFGAVVPIEEWVKVRDALIGQSHTLLRCVDSTVAPDGRAKLLVSDPSGNLIEMNSEAS